MTVLYRTTGAWGAGLGRNLTAAEVDGNFYDIDTRVDDLETSRPQPDNLTSAQSVGTQLTFYLQSGATLGPVTMPTLMWRWRGEWLPFTIYAALDVFSVAGQGMFLVLLDHTSDATFDPDATAGSPPAAVYHQLIGTGSLTNFGELADVSLTSLAANDFIAYDGTDWTNRTPSAVTALLSIFSGDAGAGGAKGLVPAPAAGDAAADKFLKADGNWTAVAIGAVAGLGTGVATFLATPSSDNLAAAITGETGSGGLVFATSPTLVTPDIGVATGTSLIAAGILQAGTTLGISTDVLLNRTAANSLALRNSTNPQSFRVYNTYTDASNGEWAYLGDWGVSSNVATYGTGKNGAGSTRGTVFVIGGTEAARLDTSRQFGLNVTSVLSLLHIGGTYTTANETFVKIDGTLVSSTTGFQQALGISPTFAPSGASLGTLYANFTSPTLDGSKNVGVFAAFSARINLAATYSGTATFGAAFHAQTPTLNGLTITPYVHFLGDVITNGDNLATGSLNNHGLRLSGITAGAAGGTITNYLLRLTMPSGGASSGAATNYGIHLSGNGGTAAGGTVTNWAIFSSSTAASQLAGTIEVTAAGSKFVDQIYDHDVVSTAQLDKTSNTTLANITGLSLALVAGKTYVIDGWLSTTAGASGGLKAAFAASGGLTATTFNVNAQSYNGTTAVASNTVATLAGNLVANTAVVTDVFISGTIVVNVAGTITLQAAQNASNATTTSVFVGSRLSARRIN